MAGRTAKTAKAAKPRASTKVGTRKKAVPKVQLPLKVNAKKMAKVKTAGKKIASTKRPVVKKAVAKKPAAKKTVAKKSAVKKRVVKKPTAPKNLVKKPSVKKAATKKRAVKKTAAKKAVVKKSARIKPANKKRPVKAKRAFRIPEKAVDKVVVAARTIGKSKTQGTSAANSKILSELADLAKYIRAAKREIAAIRPADVKDEYLPKAADELDAVVEATADATNAIMDSCEVVEGVMADVSPDVSAKLMDATTRIYEACTFQDITGQRIGKVVTTMKHIEDCIDALIDAFGNKGRPAKKKAIPRKTSAPQKGEMKNVTDADLLEGPQLGGSAKSQAEIDDLFSSFD